MAANTIQNNALAKISARAPDCVLSAITKACKNTGVNFAYMMQQAAAESGFDADAQAKSSSAGGLYQFIDRTWLSMVKKYGAGHGMGAQAAQINDQGRVSDKAVRQQILELKNDPEKASAMAAEFARENEQFLDAQWGGDVGPTELYFAHFMGAGGAASFLKARDADPTQAAAPLFPAAAKANRNVFYDTKTGRPKSMDEVYAFFDRKFEIKDAAPPENGDIAVAAHKPEIFSPRISSLVFNTQPPAETAFAKVKDETVKSGFQFAQRRYNSLVPIQQLVSSPVDIMMMSQMDLPTVDRPGKAP